MQATDIVQAILRWIHVIVGILWIGMLYFFNFVNGPLMATLDGETKKKVVPELMPRALYWFRWGAAWTWLTGILMLLLVFFHGGLTAKATGEANPAAYFAFAFLLVGPVIYDQLFKSPLGKDLKVGGAICFALVAAYAIIMEQVLGLSYRAYVIHVGALFGTTMAFNVWMRIWPAQQKIIMAVKAGVAPDAAVVALAGARSRHNTYMSVPLIWTMIDAHTTFASGNIGYLLAFIAIGWMGVNHLYKLSAKVKGF
jgi:uncharacterized membrane protein